MMPLPILSSKHYTYQAFHSDVKSLAYLLRKIWVMDRFYKRGSVNSLTQTTS